MVVTRPFAVSNRSFSPTPHSLQDIEIEMTLSTGFESGVSASVAQAQDAETTMANVDSYISACQCDSMESFTCLASPVAIGPDSILKICVRSKDSEVKM